LPFLPSELIGGDLEWLFDFVVKDQTLRFARVPLTATIAGEAFEYVGGLEFSEQFEDGIDPFGATPSERTVEITLHASVLVKVAEEFSRGYDFAAARGKLWLYERNSETAVLFLDGVVRNGEFGGIEESLTFSLEEVFADDVGLFPPQPARITETTWPNSVEKSRGERYPWVFGQPGYQYDTSTADTPHGFSYQVQMVSYHDAGSHSLLIAGHHIEATHVWIACDETGLRERCAVTNTVDANGHAVALAEMTNNTIGSGTSNHPEVDDTFFCKFHDDGGGLMHPDGSAMTGAGDVLRYMLRSSSQRIDRGRLAAAIPRLNQYRIDVAICCSPDKRFSPWSWVEDHLSTILPVSWRISVGTDGGWHPVVWPFDTTSHDAVASITATTEPRYHEYPSRSSAMVAPTAFREGRASFSSRDDVANHISIDYQNDIKDGMYWSTKTLSADPAELAAGRAGSNLYCHTSRTRYRDANNLPLTVPLELTSDVVWDDATAAAILSWRSRKHALQAVLVSYTVDAEVAGHLEPGDVLLLTDSELEFSEYLFVVEQVTWRSDRFLSLALRSLPDAARDLAGAEGEEH